MRTRRASAVGIAAVVGFAALCVGAGLFARARAPVTGTEAAADFLRAWGRSRTGTFVMTGTFERRTAAGAELTSAVRIVQRPPARLQFQFGGVEGRIGDRPVLCGATVNGRGTCRLGSPGMTYAQDVRRQVAVLGQYVGGDPPRYDVTEDGACFTLDLARPMEAPPYGERGRFCFDGETGAPTRIEIHRGVVVDLTRAISVRSSVTDADLEVAGLTS